MINMSRANAIDLCRRTMFEFQNYVMMPLQNNIGLYNRRGNQSPFILNDLYNMSSASVDNMKEMVVAMFNMGNFELSQLFSLCRDISKLYNLPVNSSMPVFICENSPIIYIFPRTTLSSFETMSGINITTGAAPMPVETRRQLIANLAKSHIESRKWTTRRQREIAGLRVIHGVSKCNIFVYEIIREAGAAIERIHEGGRWHNRLGYGLKPPVAAEWANPNFKINGWDVLPDDETPMPGDVAALAGSPARRATGHVAIVTGNRLTTGTNSNTFPIGIIEQNDWGFRAAQEGRIVFRRWMGHE